MYISFNYHLKERWLYHWIQSCSLCMWRGMEHDDFLFKCTERQFESEKGELFGSFCSFFRVWKCNNRWEKTALFHLNYTKEQWVILSEAKSLSLEYKWLCGDSGRAASNSLHLLLLSMQATHEFSWMMPRPHSIIFEFIIKYWRPLYTFHSQVSE